MSQRAAAFLGVALLLVEASSAQSLSVRPPALARAAGTRMLDESHKLRLDDGTTEGTISTRDNGAFLWLNLFSPPHNLSSFRVREVHVLWPGYVSVGQKANLYLYVDRDGDRNPSTGAVFVGMQEGIAVQFNDEATFSVYPLAQPPLVRAGEDLIVGVVNSGMTRPGEDPAAYDEDAPPGRSWVGLYNSPVPHPPTLPAPVFGRLEDLAPIDRGGVFLIRALADPLTTSLDAETPREKWIELGPPFPNPALSRTSVEVTLSAPMHVHLALYDVLGRCVVEVFEGLQMAGTHTMDAPVSRLSPGVYVWRLTTATLTRTARVVVAR